MESNIFRKKSMDRVSSPEQLNDYIKVSNPTVWMILVAIIIFLIGVCAWGYFGRLETTVSTSGEVLNGTYLAYVKEDNILEIKEGLEVRIEDKSYQVESIGKVPSMAGGILDDYLMHLGNINEDDWVYVVSGKTDLPDGNYQIEIVTESIAPMSFVLN
ncbi:MAG: hypothetical protein ACI4WM_07715 [Erysipelotrichaceae bacterium]